MCQQANFGEKGSMNFSKQHFTQSIHMLKFHKKKRRGKFIILLDYPNNEWNFNLNDILSFIDK